MCLEKDCQQALASFEIFFFFFFRDRHLTSNRYYEAKTSLIADRSSPYRARTNQPSMIRGVLSIPVACILLVTIYY